MRVLRYALRLTEFPYLITGSETVASDNMVDGWRSLPIKVTVPEKYKSSLNAAVPQLIYNEEDKDLGFQEHYQEILFGECPDWYLYSCEVTARGLVLGYYNQEANESGSIVFEDVDQPIGFRLAVPHKNGKPDSVYDVTLCAHNEDMENSKIVNYEARIVEHYADGRRELSFTDNSNQPYMADKYVYIDEYVDL